MISRDSNCGGELGIVEWPSAGCGAFFAVNHCDHGYTPLTMPFVMRSAPQHTLNPYHVPTWDSRQQALQAAHDFAVLAL